MSVGEHKSVAVEPAGSARRVTEVARPDRVGHRRAAHWGARVTRVCRLDGVDREGADRGDGGLLKSRIHR